MITINFDMDGTIANLYGVQNWLEYLQQSNSKPYYVAKPMLNMSVLARRLNRLKAKGCTINVISWLSKEADEDFSNQITMAKTMWLQAHLKSVHWDNIAIVPYGVPKHTIFEGILFDDEIANRENWSLAKETNIAYDVNNILKILKEIETSL